MVLRKGDVVAVITRRAFKEDLVRHFVGQVIQCSHWVASVRGFQFFLDDTTHTFVRKNHERTRLISLVDAGLIITLLPNEIELDQLRHEDVGGQLLLRDGKQLELDLSEYRRST